MISFSVLHLNVFCGKYPTNDDIMYDSYWIYYLVRVIKIKIFYCTFAVINILFSNNFLKNNILDIDITAKKVLLYPFQKHNTLSEIHIFMLRMFCEEFTRFDADLFVKGFII